MLVPKRLLVLKRLCTLLEELEVDGAIVDMSGKITRGRNIMGEEVQAPALSILEAPRPEFATYAGEEHFMRKESMLLMIQGRAVDDKLNPGDPAYYLEAAVEKRLSMIIAEKSGGRPLYPEHHMLGKLITSMEVAPPVVRPPEDKVSASAFFFLVLRVGIAVDISEPYTQDS